MYPKFNEIANDMPTWTVALLTKIEERETKSKQAYCVFHLQDGSKCITANLWNTKKENIFKVQEQSLITVQLYKKIYNGTESFEIKQFEPATADAKLEDFIITAPIPSEDMYQKIQDILLKEIGNTELYVLTMKFMEMYKEKLFTWSAAKMVHHNCYGGLLYHMFRMLKTGVILSRVYDFHKEILFSAIVFHDAGKLLELETDPLGSAEYTVDGTLFGHALLSVEMIDTMVANAQMKGINYNQEKIRLLKHCIVSHHGKQEWGAITTPAIREAMLLHEIDMIDSCMWQYEQVEKELEPGTVSDKVFGLEGKVYKPMF